MLREDRGVKRYRKKRAPSFTFDQMIPSKKSSSNQMMVQDQSTQDENHFYHHHHHHHQNNSSSPLGPNQASVAITVKREEDYTMEQQENQMFDHSPSPVGVTISHNASMHSASMPETYHYFTPLHPLSENLLREVNTGHHHASYYTIPLPPSDGMQSMSNEASANEVNQHHHLEYVEPPPEIKSESCVEWVFREQEMDENVLQDSFLKEYHWTYATIDTM